MSAGWLIYITLVVALLAAAAWAAESFCRQLGRPTRWSWLGATVAVVVLVARAALVGDASPTSVLLAKAAVGSATLPPESPGSLLTAMRDAIALAGSMLATLVALGARTLPARAVGLAATVWAGASALALVVLALVHQRIRRARRAWPAAELHGSRVRIAPDVGPAVVGVVRPEIVIPRWVLGCTTAEQRLVLAHESEHLRGRDHLLLGIGSLVVALVPWHPAVWWMLARLRLAIELDCDARVLRRGVRAKDYGAVLIDLAGRCTGFRVGATALADEGSHLERRLLAMNANRAGRRWLRAGVLGSAAGLALLAACEAKVPTGPEIQSMDVASAGRAATSARLLEKSQMDSAVFYLDGKEVDAKTANSLTPNQIASIDINKGGVQPVIRIRTNGQAPAATTSKGDVMRLRTGMLGDTVRNRALRATDSVSRKFDGLLLIDGVKTEASALATLDRNRIESIEVIKGAAAEQQYPDPAAKNGVILIRTKK